MLQRVVTHSLAVVETFSPKFVLSSRRFNMLQDARRLTPDVRHDCRVACPPERADLAPAGATCSAP